MKAFLSDLWFSIRVSAASMVSYRKARQMVSDSGESIPDDGINYLHEFFSDLWFSTKVSFVSFYSEAKAREMVTKHPVREG